MPTPPRIPAPASLDFETYSEAGYSPGPSGKWIGTGIKAVGGWAYAQHPSTDIICAAYDLHDGTGPQLWIPGCPPPEDLWAAPRIAAWNSDFEYAIWLYVATRRYGWPVPDIARFVCTASSARRYSLPRALEHAAEAVGSPQNKDKRGTALIKKYCVPHRSTLFHGARTLPVDPAIYDYCLQDIATEAAIADRIPPMPDDEAAVRLVDARINARGVAVDVKSVADCQRRVAAIRDELTNELCDLTEGNVTSAGEVARIREELKTEGVRVAALDADAVTAALEKTTLTPRARRLLELRQALALSSVNKLDAMADRTGPDGRMRGSFLYYGAATGRWAGVGAQPQNMPPTCDDPEAALILIRSGCGDLSTVAGVLRALLIAGPGCDLICSDYSAIEAVVLAMLSGEQWMIDAFRTHGKIYEATAATITGVPVEEILEYKRRTGEHHPHRKLGKVGSLAANYRGWIDAWKNFGADKYFESDEAIKEAILKWRARSPAVVEFWGGQYRKGIPERFGLEGAAINALENPGVVMRFRSIAYVHNAATGVLHCRLPSGRELYYHGARLVDEIDRYSGRAMKVITYQRYLPGSGKSVTAFTHGGVLTENVVSGASRDILSAALLRLEDHGYPVVLHVHDEIVCEVPEGFGSVDELERLMMVLPQWAEGWPIRARDGWRGKRYRK